MKRTGVHINGAHTDTAIGTLQPHEIYKYFIKILYDNSVDFQVAPYSAWPQV